MPFYNICTFEVLMYKTICESAKLDVWERKKILSHPSFFFNWKILNHPKWIICLLHFLFVKIIFVLFHCF